MEMVNEWAISGETSSKMSFEELSCNWNKIRLIKRFLFSTDLIQLINLFVCYQRFFFSEGKRFSSTE
jgi:hypothetical protein